MPAAIACVAIVFGVVFTPFLGAALG